MDHFEVFGLPRRLAIDAAELQRKFYELSRRGHPDYHQDAPPERQAEILEASVRLNAAYRALRDPIARIEYLVRLEEGRETREGATVKPKAPPELLEEMFEIQEALQTPSRASRAGSTPARGRHSSPSESGCARATSKKNRDCAGRSARRGMRPGPRNGPGR